MDKKDDDGDRRALRKYNRESKENRANQTGKPPSHRGISKATQQLFDNLRGFNKIVEKSDAILKKKQRHERA